MHSAQRAFLLVERDIAFGQLRFQSAFDKVAMRAGESEEATFILELFEFDDERSFKLCLSEDHRSQLPQSLRLLSTLESEL